MYKESVVHEVCSCNFTFYTKQVRGIKGPSVLALHHCFDLVGGVVIDDLHGIYLGVTLTLLHLWFDRSNRGKMYYIGNKVYTHSCPPVYPFMLKSAFNVISHIQIQLCDKMLLSIKVTDSMSRVPKSLEDFTHWKGIHTQSLVQWKHSCILAYGRCRIEKLAVILLPACSPGSITQPIY